MRVKNIKHIREYVLAGAATFTLENPKSGIRYTYRVTRDVDGKQRWFVGLLSGPDNTHDFTYLGLIIKDTAYRFILTKASKLTLDATPTKGARWLTLHLNNTEGELPSEILFHHSGRCSRCGRLLTTPESVERGLGPKCADYAGEGL